MLAERTLQLVNVPSVSLAEAALADLIAESVPLTLVHRQDSTLLFATERTGRPLVVLAGHLDTVPPQDNLPGRIADGAVHGLGAADMKGGLAVMVELAHWLAAERPARAADVALLFFPREELPAEQSALPDVFAAGLIDGAELVVVLEPTANAIQAGCLGHISGTLVFDGTAIGGSSFMSHVAHAQLATEHGLCEVAVIAYGSTQRSVSRAAASPREPNFYENPYRPFMPSSAYAMAASRHMHQYGTTHEQFAHISVATRRHAMRNPEAVQAMTDLEFVGVREISVNDVLESRLIAYPLRLLECCMVSDGGGAVVIASAEVARNTRKKPVWIIGTGQATKYRENNGDITVSAGAQSGPQAFSEAGITPAQGRSLLRELSEAGVRLAEDDEEVAFAGGLEVAAHMEVGVHPSLEDGDSTKLAEFAGVRLVVEGAGDQDVEAGIAGLTCSLNKVRP